MTRIRFEGTPVVNLSGGKDSTAMLLRMLEERVNVKHALFFDTGWEFPQMEAHIEKLAAYTGVGIRRLRPHRPFDWHMTAKPITKRNGKTQFGQGWPSIKRRWCTKFKVRALEAAAKALSYTDDLPIEQCIGFSLDETGRVERMADRAGKDAEIVRARFPLVEWKMTERDCLDYCYARGFRWDGLYEVFDRVSCFCCPLQGKMSLGKLRRHYPDLFRRMIDMEERISAGVPKWFTMDKKTVAELDAEFAAKGQRTLFS
jgi:3'-phosphoadenosine 5'-phosphosulfate sulfotransferase (PAPS reductase)/FAD synthetase